MEPPQVRGLLAGALAVTFLTVGAPVEVARPPHQAMNQQAEAPRLRPRIDPSWLGIVFGKPCPTATKVNVADLVAKQRVWLPVGRRVDASWECNGFPYFMYDGIQVVFATGYAHFAPEFAADYANQWGGYTVDVNGRLAAVLPGDKPGLMHEVDLIAGDVSVLLLAPRSIPIERVLDLLRAMPVPAA